MHEYPVRMDVRPEVQGFFHAASNTITYLVTDPATGSCAIIDSVLDLDYSAGRVATDSADLLVAAVRGAGLSLEWIIETHVHADHLSAAPYLQQQLGGRLGIGAGIVEVQETFGKIFNEGTEFARDGSQFDALYRDGDTYTIGTLPAFVMETPGHTPACMVHVIGSAAFIGDTLFMPDGGSARADFPGGDAALLYDSIQKILDLPDDMVLHVCHDYAPGGRDFAWQTTVGEQKAANIHLAGNRTREDFVALRTARDAQLAMPRLILPSLQVNMRAGEVPRDDGGNPVLKVPINALD